MSDNLSKHVTLIPTKSGEESLSTWQPILKRFFASLSMTYLLIGRTLGPVCIAAVLLAALVLAPPAHAQTTIRGAVTDAETGTPLPSATLQVEDAMRGTITNEEGRYALYLEALPATVRVRFIGYSPVERRITTASEVRQDFVLQPTPVEMNELTVTADRQPAREIMRKVIARKQARREQLETYRADAYNRFTLANDTGIVSIVESLTEWVWSAERGSREIVKGRRATVNLDLDQYLPAGLFVMNLYDDNVEAAGYELIGVTHPRALDVYRFELEGVRALGNQKVFDLSVRPEERLTSGFVGRLAVLDSAYALLEARLQPSAAFHFPPPIQQLQVAYRQQFADFGGFWLPVSFHSTADVKVAFPGLLTFPTFHIEQIARLTDYAVNVALPDSLFESDDYLRVDTAAVNRDSLLARSGTAVPLTDREAKAFTAIDSAMTLEDAFHPSGLLARFLDFSAAFDGEEEKDSEEKTSGGEEGSGPVLPFDQELQLWFNRVDALHAAVRLGLHVGPQLTISGLGGYKTGLRRVVYGGDLGYDLGGATTLRLGYVYAVDPRYHSAYYGRFLNSAQVLLAKPDYFDYYSNERVHLEVSHHVSELNAGVTVAFRNERHRSVERTTSYDLFGDAFIQPPNPPVEEGILRSVAAEATFGDEGGVLPGLMGHRSLYLGVEHSLPALGSDFTFTRFSLDGIYAQETFFRRRFLPMKLHLRLSAGAALGTLPPQRFGIVEASLRPYSPFGVLHTLPNRPYEGSRHLAFFWEHNFRTVPFEILGLRPLVHWGWELIVGGAHGRTWIPGERLVELPYVPNVPDGFHHELTLSVNRVLGLFRVDFSKRLDAEGFAVGIGVARVF